MTGTARNTLPKAKAMPARAGAGLKPVHYRSILDDMPDIGFFEIHAENYMGDGGPPHRYLEAVRSRYPISVHGVGMSIGADRPLDHEHLERLKRLLERYEPALFSEHLAWSTHDVGFFNDLLPIPYTDEALRRVCDHVDEIQTKLRRRMLLENPSTYIVFAESAMPEVEFLTQVAAHTGCGLLLDVNNVEVSAANHGYDPLAYLDAFPFERVGEIHLAGFAEAHDDEGHILIDAHDSPVRTDVWALYTHVLNKLGPIPTLIEWDNDIPAWPVLFAEAARAERLLDSSIGCCDPEGALDASYAL